MEWKVNPNRKTMLKQRQTGDWRMETGDWRLDWTGLTEMDVVSSLRNWVRTISPALLGRMARATPDGKHDKP